MRLRLLFLEVSHTPALPLPDCEMRKGLPRFASPVGLGVPLSYRQKCRTMARAREETMPATLCSYT